MKDAIDIQLALQEVLDMIQTKLAEREIESLIILTVSKDKNNRSNKETDSVGRNYLVGSRYLVQPDHLDLMEELFVNTMDNLVAILGVTPEQSHHIRLQGKIGKTIK